jgi:hypothetical protein
VIAAALLVDADNQTMVAESGVEVVEMGERDGDEGGRFVMSAIDEPVEEAFADDGSAHAEGPNGSSAQSGCEHIGGDGNIAGISEPREGEIVGSVPRVSGKFMVGA